ncbi:M6 family metalloprotease domain protein [Segatella baroniae F0067]|uniref:M6 family metalloprotease domain protein n=1 Tax=Segatella baroniae F0067 TaxID=1115809 RepID=U2QA93_9BACT|nr:M6 family metalloprotease domain-containing protein [Segatella baroniae]ERK38248.1 M6 family metalloprotease domain protein [Segatella baroniae F0067]
MKIKKKTILHLLTIATLLVIQLPASAQDEILGRPGKCAFNEVNAQRTTRAIIPYNPVHIPTNLGPSKVVTIPVFLAEFQDVKFSVHQLNQAFEQYFNGETLVNLGNGNDRNFGSVRKYFHDISNGDFNVKFKIYGPVTLSKEMKYYGGTNISDGGDGSHREELVNEAVNLAQSMVSTSDAQTFDANNDGYIDCVYVIYAGMGKNFNAPVEEYPQAANTVWACTSVTNGTLAGKQIGWYSIAGELIPGKVKNTNDWYIQSIGVTCHELSHAMGLPDIYPPTSSAGYKNHNQNMEYWDLMDGGEYVNNGWHPTPYTAWEKHQLGWSVDIRKLTTSQTITMDKTILDQGPAYKIENPNNPYEYFIIENIKKTPDTWYQKAPNSGLLIYHVFFNNDNTETFAWVNATPGKPNMAVVPADGTCFSYDLLSTLTHLNQKERREYYRTQLAGDPFPGTAQTNKLDDTSNLPNFYWYTQGAIADKALYNSQYYKTNVALKNITEYNGTVTFEFIGDVTTGIDHLTNKQTTYSPIYTLNGHHVGTDATSLPKGIYIKNHKKFVVK